MPIGTTGLHASGRGTTVPSRRGPLAGRDPEALVGSTYRRGGDKYLAEVAPQIVSWDYYPFLLQGDLPGFFENMAIVRAHSLAANRPFWQFVQAISFVGHRATTAAEKAT